LVTKEVILRPLDWDDSAGTGWFNTVTSSNKSKAYTAMFYGRSFNQAGWLAVFKNTEKTAVKINKLYSYIGTAKGGSNITAQVMCMPLGKTFKSNTGSISIPKGYTHNVSCAYIPKVEKLGAAADTVVATLNKPVQVESGEFFCIGFISKNIPSGYFNMALRRLSKAVNNIFYTQDSDTSKTVTWYRSGNANDNTNWKKHYAYIWASGTAVEAQIETPAITYPAPTVPPVIPEPIPEPSENSVYLNIGKVATTIAQGSITTFTVSAGIKIDNLPKDGKHSLKQPKIEIKETDSSNAFSVSESGGKVTVKSTGYSNKNLSVTVQVTAKSQNGTGNKQTKIITITATPPTIDTLTVSKSRLRPTETATIDCTYSSNAGGITYSINNDTDVTLDGSKLNANANPTYTEKGTVTVTATTKNGGVTKSIKVPLVHWGSNDLQIALSSTQIFADSLFGDSNDKITVTNTSTNNLKVDYRLTKNTTLSFSDEVDDNIQDNVSVNAVKTLYTYKSSETTTDTLIATLACDKSISKSFTIDIKKASTATLAYPLGLVNSNTLNLPAIAQYNNATKKYDVYFSTYPLQININNTNNLPITVVLKAGTSELKIGNAFKNCLLNGKYWIRPDVVCTTGFTSSSWPATKAITYTLTVSDTTTPKLFEKVFTIKYTVYRELDDLISSKCQGTSMTAEKAETTLGIARTILNQYKPTTITKISKDNYINNCSADLVSVLTGLSDLINTITNKSASFVTLQNNHRTKIAQGQYIMADDSVEKLADGRVNTFKTSDRYGKETASPFREIVKAIKNFTGQVTHRAISYNGIEVTSVTKADGTKVTIDKLYL
jgi:hypothetical protein